MALIVDLDDTLISSTKLNNDAYNYALEKFGFPRVETKNRITRECLKISDLRLLNKIIKEKQRYFCLAWLPYRIILNDKLLKIIKESGRENSFLWTAADNKRAKAILNHCNLNYYFNSVILDKKTDFLSSMALLKRITHSDDLTIYENNYLFFPKKTNTNC